MFTSGNSETTAAANLTTGKVIISTLGSAIAGIVVARTIARDLLPEEVQYYFSSAVYSLYRRFSSELTLVIDEFHGMEGNHIYESAAFYLGAKTRAQASSTSSTNSTGRLKLSKAEKEDGIYVDVDKGEEIIDEFDGLKFRWILISRQLERVRSFYNPRDMNSTLRSEVRHFELSFHKKHKKKAIDEYIPHIIDCARKMKYEIKTVKIHTTTAAMIEEGYGDVWDGIKLDHPATFETIAMDLGMKERIMEDLDRFVSRREYYRRVGKAWKRGYLLYGPPGTGKSSLIAAMANYLKFDIYDLELTALSSNTDLRKVLVSTANRSILVVEDIDCSIDLQNRGPQDSNENYNSSGGEGNEKKKQVTLSGLLNFMDGLWSSCGDERIIIITTNYKDKLDPALLRPGRMDFHIHMSYCSPTGFETLAKNYLQITSHSLFDPIKCLIESIQVTPAEVAEQLMKHDDAEPALTELLDFLESKKKEVADKPVKAEQDSGEQQEVANETVEISKMNETLGEPKEFTTKGDAQGP